ncbi:PAS domain-containing protein [Caulobacter segnis]
MAAKPIQSSSLDGLSAEGEIGKAMRAIDWMATPLGSPEAWPQSLRTSLELLLNSKHGMMLAWGPELTLFYNQAYAPFLGLKHPAAFGRPFAEVWSDIWTDIEPLVRQTLAGEAVWFEDYHLVMERHGFAEDTWWQFSYSPARDDNGQIVGLLNVTSEMTGKVLTERRQAFRLTLEERLHNLADPSEIVAAASEALGRHLGVAQVAYAKVEPGDQTVVIEREWNSGAMASNVGRHRLDDYGPEFIADLKQGKLVAIGDVTLDPRTSSPEVLATFTRASIQAFLNVPVVKGDRLVAVLAVHSPVTHAWSDEEIALAKDVAERTWAAEERAFAEQRLGYERERLRATVELADRFRDLVSIPDILFAAAQVLGRALGASRAGYGAIDDKTETLFVDRDWTKEGVETLAGATPLRNYGSFIETLKHGQPVVISDVREDDRTRDASVALEARDARSFANVPVIEQGRLVAVFFANDNKVRAWRPDELALIQDVADRTRAAVERVRVETALRESEARLRVLNADLESQVIELASERGITWQVSPYMLSVVGLDDGRFVRVNPAWTDILGWTAEDMAGRTYADFLHPDDLIASQAAFAQVSGGKPVLNFENRLRAKSGQYHWLSSVAVPNNGRLYSTARDITAEKLAAAERERIFAMSRDLFGVATFDGYLRTINPAWSAVLGRSEAELLAVPFAEIIHPDDLALTGEVVATLLGGAPVHQFHVRLLRADGTPIAYAWSAVPDTQADSGIFYTVGRDITEETAKAAELAATQEALRQAQKMDAMGQLTGGVAHDFNNLLTPIVGSLDLLQRQGVGGAREQRLIAGAIQSADRAKTLVQRLLAFARRQPLKASAVDVGQLVDGMADLLASTTGPQIRVVVEIAPNLPPAKADPNQLEMALLNLGVNARDAMPDGGTLRISATCEHVGHDRGNPKRGDYVRLSVADTGVGMDEATLARAVEPFFSTKGIGKGTGLGLSMAHGLAAQLGGALTVKSRVGVGTNVELWLPLSDMAISQGDGLAIPVLGSDVRGLALLVDDEEFVRASTADMLEDLGYQVQEAVSAEAALTLIRDGLRPDVIITDHLMPGMTGVDLARTVRERAPNLPVLIVSGYAEAEGIAPDLPRLTKPFKSVELEASLATLATGASK